VLTNLHSFSPAEKANLNEEEQQIFSTFLQAMDKKFQFDNIKCQPKAPETSNIALPKEKNISPKELYDLATEILNFYKYLYPHNQELQQWEIVQEPNSNFINVSGKEKVLSIPTAYDNVDSEKVTRTIAAHEIEQHVIQRVNNHTLF
jgi:predicted aldo/keto reductase-like oxidoreductase